MPGHSSQQHGRGRVDIDPDAVDARFNDLVEGHLQTLGIDIVLVLPDAQRLGLDLDQFGQGVLQAPGDGNGATNGQV